MIYWVDPTHTLQGGGFKNSVIQNYDKVLVIGLPSDTLSSMNFKDTLSKIFFQDEYFVTSFFNPVLIKMQTSRFGLESDIKRIYNERISKEEVSKELINELKLKYDKVNQESEIFKV